MTDETSVPPDTEETPEKKRDGDSLEDLVAAGFSSKDRLSAHLKSLGETSKKLDTRKVELDTLAQTLVDKEVQLEKKQKAVEEKGEEVLSRLAEQRILFEKNQEVSKKMQELKELLNS